VGGHFARIERLEGSQFAFLLADVTSHSVSAALFTLHLRSLWEEHAFGSELFGLLGAGIEPASHRWLRS
jgi:hypothetical protein